MTSFDFEISEKDRAGADFVQKAGRRLQEVFVRKCQDEKLTKVEVARRLDVDKSTVSKMLSGNANLTLRTLGELCWALDVDEPDIHMPQSDYVKVARQNYTSQATTSAVVTFVPKPLTDKNKEKNPGGGLRVVAAPTAVNVSSAKNNSSQDTTRQAQFHKANTP